MRSSIRRFGLVAVPSLLALVACGAPPDGEHASETGDDLVRPILPVVTPWVAPTYYAAGSSQMVKMAAEASNVCVLQSVSGQFYGNTNVAKIVTQGGYYYLQTGPNDFARAACAPWSDFTGTNVSSPQTTVDAPWWLTSAPNGNGTSYGSFKNPLWQGLNVQCYLSGIGGQWAGLPYGNLSAAERSAFIGYEGGTYLGEFANGPGITAYADCLKWPSHTSQLTTTTAYAYSQGSPSVALPSSTSQGLCGLIWIEGELAGTGDGVNIFEYGNGTQMLNLFGGAANAGATCLQYAQQGP